MIPHGLEDEKGTAVAAPFRSVRLPCWIDS